MSRSRKRHPIYKYKFKGGKKAAAKAFRRFKEDVPIYARQFFRRVYNSYNVWDNWWLCEENLKERQRFTWLRNELFRNETEHHLTEEQAYEYLDEMNDLKYSFNLMNK